MTNTVEIALGYFDAIGKRALDRALRYFDDLAILVFPDGTRVTGPQIAAEIASFLQPWTEFSVRPMGVFEDRKGQVAVEWLMKGTLHREESGPSVLDLSGIDVFEFRSNRILVLRGYFDLNTYRRARGARCPRGA